MTETGRRASDSISLPMIPQSSPWWVQVGLIVLFWLGPAALTATFFMLVFTGYLRSPIVENNDILKRMEPRLNTAISAMETEVSNSRRNDEQVVRLLLATCRNVARDEVGRINCDNYWRR